MASTFTKISDTSMKGGLKETNEREATASQQHQLPATVVIPEIHKEPEGKVTCAREKASENLDNFKGVLAGNSSSSSGVLHPLMADSFLSAPPPPPYRPSPEAAWEYFRRLGSPKLHVAPMVDASELPFRMLCRKWGAEAAYTPMIHSRLFLECGPKHRHEHFTTCPEDRPLFVQFCANDPATLLGAAKLVEHQCDYVDLNLGCPQRIAKRGYYGAFLMDNLPLVRSLVSTLTSSLRVPVSCKIRIFPDLQDTLAYARMLEDAGCALLAVHGRTRDQKCGKLRADWDAIRAVKQALRIPVLANGNVRWLEDAEECMLYTGADGVLSAETLLSNPALFAGHRLPGDPPAPREESPKKSEQQEEQNRRQSAATSGALEPPPPQDHPQSEEPSGTSEAQGRVPIAWGAEPDPTSLLLEYLDNCEKYPVHMRMVRGHVHRMLGGWFRLHTDLRNRLNREHRVTLDFVRELVAEIRRRKEEDPTLMPLPEVVGNNGGREGGGGSGEGKGGAARVEEGKEGEKRGNVVEVGIEVVPHGQEGDEKRVKFDVRLAGQSGLSEGSDAAAHAAVSLAS